MATVKGLYELIKKRQAEGEEIGILEQSIIEAYEADEPNRTTKEVQVSFIKKKLRITKLLILKIMTLFDRVMI